MDIMPHPGYLGFGHTLADALALFIGMLLVELKNL
jgi:hypothetical protein